MEKRFLVNPMAFAYALAVSLIMALMAGVMIHIRRPFSMAAFLVLALVFLIVAIQNAAVITVNREGVARSVLGIRRRFLPWTSVGEVGVAGLKVIKRKDSKKTGSLYIYFWEKHMTEKERFDMILHWPHFNTCYMLFSYERIRAVQMLWDNLGTVLENVIYDKDTPENQLNALYDSINDELSMY